MIWKCGVSLLCVVVVALYTSTLVQAADCYDECEHQILAGFTTFHDDICCDVTLGQTLEGLCDNPNNQQVSCFRSKREWDDDADCECEGEVVPSGLAQGFGNANANVYYGSCDFESEDPCKWTADPGNPVTFLVDICEPCP